MSEEDKYVDIYKKNKIEKDITETVNHLIYLGEIHKHIVNSLDNTFIITKNNATQNGIAKKHHMKTTYYSQTW